MLCIDLQEIQHLLCVDITFVILCILGVGWSIMTSSPTQLQSLVPIQESSPGASLVPIPELSPKGAKPPKPLLYGLHETGIDGDDAEPDYVPEIHNVPGSVDERTEDDRRTTKIKNLMRNWHNKTGEGPFEKDNVILTDKGHGVVKCVFLVDEDKALKAGIEVVSTIRQVRIAYFSSSLLFCF